jgi:hypothetical protein
MDDDLDDYKLDATWHENHNHVIHISFERGRRHGGCKAKVENKWFRQRELGAGSCGVVYLETTEDGRERAVKSIRKTLAARLRIDYRRELAAISTFSKAKVDCNFLASDSCLSILGALGSKLSFLKILTAQPCSHIPAKILSCNVLTRRLNSINNTKSSLNSLDGSRIQDLSSSQWNIFH